MHPVLVDFGRVKLYSFGLMVALAFLAAGWMVSRELARRDLEPSHAEGYPLVALLAGLAGARLYFLGEHWDVFLRDPLGSLFTSAGLTWYGGAAAGALAVLLWAHRRKQPLWSVCDAFAPGLAAAYAIGRIGCQLAGDGDYGRPSHLPWAMAYPHGIVPTLVPVHPTPIYEMLAMGLVAAVLWRLRTRPWAQNGSLFGLYLVLAGAERFLVEFVRINPRVVLGLTVAQVTSVVAVAAGLWIFAWRRGVPAVRGARVRSPAKRPKGPARRHRAR
jgi:phosphatidylglycerol:prolipoprotein diacylglycerol transferase